MIRASITAVRKRGENDCVTACLAMLLEVPYEAALVAVSQVDQRMGQRGLWARQTIRAARRLGVTLRARRRGRYDLDQDTGILHVDQGETAHAVLLFRGIVIEPDDGSVWDDVRAYVDTLQTPRLGSLLVVAGEQ